MLQEFVHCKKCVENLCLYGRLPLDVYLGICEQYAHKNLILCSYGKHGKGDPIISFLESKGFIVTTEHCHDSLAVKPIGYIEHNSNYNAKTTHEFCIQRNIH